MSYLLDTHAFYWFVRDPSRMAHEVHDMLLTHPGPVYVSAITGYEIQLKSALGKLEWGGTVADAADAAGFDHLPVSIEHAERAASLPLHHRDPFDRVLIAQAQVEELTLLTNDRLIGLYKVTSAAC